MRNKRTIYLSLLAMLLPLMSSAQITLDPVIVNPVINEGGWNMRAELTVTFYGAEDGVEIASNGFMHVHVNNLDELWTDNSKITAFYLLKPIVSGDTAAETLAEGGGSFTNDPASWQLDNSLSPDLVGTLGFGNPSNEYFGMSTQVQNGYPITSPADPPNFPGTGDFYFYFDTLDGEVFNPFTWFYTTTQPLAFVRWQEVGVEGNDGWSAKGIGYGDPGFNPVPEPSEVALMAMFGLGGLLYVRKRFMKIKK